MQVVVGEVMKLRPRFTAAVAKAKNEAQGLDPDTGIANAHVYADDDDEVVRGIVRLFMDIAEAYDSILSTGSAEV